MSVQIKIFGAPRRAKLVDDEAILKFASRLKIGDKKVNFIELKLKDNAVKGQAKFSMTGFQSLIVNIANGKSAVSLTKDAKGQSTSLYSTDFVYDGMTGERVAYIPDTQFNRKALIDNYHFGAKYEILDEEVEAAVKKDADALKKRFETAKKKAFDKAEKEVHADRAVYIEGFNGKIGDGFRDTAEYKAEVGKEVTRLAAKYFGEDGSWREGKKAAAPAE